jgi:hypothetical protein
LLGVVSIVFFAFTAINNLIQKLFMPKKGRDNILYMPETLKTDRKELKVWISVLKSWKANDFY